MYYFRHLKMSAGKKTYNFFQLSSAVLMILALMWLSKSSSAPTALDMTEDETNPFGNNTEEKAPGSINSFSEEYLHNHHDAEYLLSIALQYHKNDDAGTYIAFHGELLVPPPNAA
jgi:hypothetical protein